MLRRTFWDPGIHSEDHGEELGRIFIRGATCPELHLGNVGDGRPVRIRRTARTQLHSGGRGDGEGEVEAKAAAEGGGWHGWLTDWVCRVWLKVAAPFTEVRPQGGRR